MVLNSTNTTNKNLGFQSSSGVGILAYSQINYIPGGDGLAAIYVKKNSEAGQYFYVYKDHLGSILTLTDDQGGVVYEQNFDAWGRLRNADTWAYDNTSPAGFEWLNRGYTGHEHLYEFALVNMNNRVYDPLLGRFLAVDNYVQDPFSSQGYNRFSYCFNNPLKYTDPSGEASSDAWMYNKAGFNNNGGEPTYDGGTKPPVIIDGNENEGESIASNEMRMPTVSYGSNVNIYSFSSKRNFNNSWNFINPISTIPLKPITINNELTLQNKTNAEEILASTILFGVATSEIPPLAGGIIIAGSMSAGIVYYHDKLIGFGDPKNHVTEHRPWHQDPINNPPQGFNPDNFPSGWKGPVNWFLVGSGIYMAYDEYNQVIKNLKINQKPITPRDKTKIAPPIIYQTPYWKKQ